MLTTLPLLALLAATSPNPAVLPISEEALRIAQESVGEPLPDDAIVDPTEPVFDTPETLGAEPLTEGSADPTTESPTDPTAEPPSDGDGGGAPTTAGASAGLDPFVTGLAQVGAGCGTGLAIGLVTAPCAFIPYVGACISLPIACATPLAVGAVETIVGDALGQKRGALLWPILGTYGALLAGQVLIWGTALVSAALVGGGIAGLTGVVTRSGTDPQVLLAALLGSYGVVLGAVLVAGLVSSVLYYVTPAIVYAFTSEDKKPGDTGFRFPGLVAPSHAEPGETVQLLPGEGPVVAEQAMAF